MAIWLYIYASLQLHLSPCLTVYSLCLCVFVCVCASVDLCVWVSMSVVYLCVYVCMSVYVCLYDYTYTCLRSYLSSCLTAYNFCLCVFVCVCVSVCISVYVCLTIQICMSSAPPEPRLTAYSLCLCTPVWLYTCPWLWVTFYIYTRECACRKPASFVYAARQHLNEKIPGAWP